VNQARGYRLTGGIHLLVYAVLLDRNGLIPP